MYKNNNCKPKTGRGPVKYSRNPGIPIGSNRCCCPKPPPEDEKCENVVNINTSVQVTQSNQADANGGSGGSGGSAAAAGAIGERNEVEAEACSSTKTENEVENETESEINSKKLATEAADVAPEDAEALEDLEGTNTQTVAASGGSGGEGGRGGEVSQSNSASITIDNVNVIVLACNTDIGGTSPALTLNRGDRQLDLKIDEDGNTFINGKKMEEVALENGTKVFVFRDSENKKLDPEI